MNDKNTGGPAFPHIDSGCGRFEQGMLLRDYFAAKAMQAFITLHEEALVKDGACYDWSKDGSSSEIVSEQSYGVADAMLRARGQR